jgi:hypothetical protein
VLKSTNSPGWFFDCFGQSMQKPSLSVDVVNRRADHPSGVTRTSENVAEQMGTHGQRRNLHARFNPAAVGFGILEPASLIVANPTQADQATVSANCRRSTNLEEGK